MYCLLYSSISSDDFTDKVLDEILAVSRQNNSDLEVTGMLMHKGGVFLQILEGPLPAVKALFAKISIDPRHKLVKVIQEGPIAERSFGDWSMAYSETEHLEIEWINQVLKLSKDPNNYFEKFAELRKTL